MSFILFSLSILVGTTFVLWVWLSRRQKAIKTKANLSSAFANFPVKMQSQNIGGFQMAYVDIGRGRPFVLVHGLGASSYCFRFLIPLLQSQGRVIAVDLVGFGQSQKPISATYDILSQVHRLEEFLEALGIQGAVLVGSSMGGLICLYLANRRPDLVARQILLSPSLFVQTFLPRLFLDVGRPLIRTCLGEKTLAHFLKRIVTRHDLIDQTMIKNYLDPLIHRSSPYILTESLKSISDPRWARDLVGTSCTPLILWGERDKILPVSLIKKISQLIPGARFEIHPDGGHHIQEDDPVWVNLKISQHLNKGL